MPLNDEQKGRRGADKHAAPMSVRCLHPARECLNPYELVRKYRCPNCATVMMCRCDEEFTGRFLPHQLGFATELHTQQRVPVTGGFQPAICNTCRGLPEEAHPKAQMRGCSTKVRRYYWREIFMETTRRFDEWARARGLERTGIGFAKPFVNERERIEREVVEEIKAQHARDPKYSFREDSQNDVIQTNNVEVVNLRAEYVHAGEEKAAVLHAGRRCTVEEFASRYFETLGYEVLVTESRPFHVLFAVFLWMVIQDPDDPMIRSISFGDRNAFERHEQGASIWTLLPSDFGAPGYWARRGEIVQAWLKEILFDGAVEATFAELLPGAADLRQYLWAHADRDLNGARQILAVLPNDTLRSILAYLAGDYWRRHCGWPDLLVHRDGEYFFAEVKSSKDKLSEDQKRWVDANTSVLKLPFKLVKIHKLPSCKPAGEGKLTPTSL